MMSDKFDLQRPNGKEDDLDTATTNDSIEIELVSETAWAMEQRDKGPVNFEKKWS